MIKHQLVPAKNWIIENQNKSGSINWDHRGKCDPWDHCECLIALAIYEEWDAFNKGIEWFFKNLNADGEIAPEFINEKVTKNHFESHHSPYIFLPLYQKFLIDNDIDYLLKYKKEIQDIYNSTLTFADSDGFLFWAKDKDGFSDNPKFTCLVADINNSVVGMALFYGRYSTWKGRTLHLEDLIVKKAFRGKGIGKKLYRKFIQIAKVENVRRAEWVALDWNINAIKFYKNSCVGF